MLQELIELDLLLVVGKEILDFILDGPLNQVLVLNQSIYQLAERVQESWEGFAAFRLQQELQSFALQESVDIGLVFLQQNSQYLNGPF